MMEHSLDMNPNVVFCHMRKTAGTSVVQALEHSSCKLPRHHRNGQAWTGPRNDENAKIIRIWDMKRDEWNEYMRERREEDRSTVVLEWNAPSFLEELTDDDSYEVFSCLREPYARFCSEFYFHDNFHTRLGDSTEKQQQSPTAINPAERRETEDGFVEESRVGLTASEWMQKTLYWKRDGAKPFKVAINKPNYMVRWFCGLFDQPDVELTNEHLEKAKSILRKQKGIMILGDPDSYSLLRRYNFSGRLGRVRVNTSRRMDTLMDISKEEFDNLNALDVALFAYAKELTEQRKQEEAQATITLNAPRTPEQDEIMKDIDIVVPVKERGVLVRATLEALDKFYAPRRLIIVSNAEELVWVKEQVDSGNWSDIQTPIEVVDEDTLWMAQPLGLSRQEMESAFNASIVARVEAEDMTIAAREFGWYLQQCIKLGIGLLLPSISETYVVWDADLLPMRRWKLCERTEDGEVKFYTAILQRTARAGNAYEYLRCLKASTGIEPARPEQGGTFVTHHMVFNKSACQELLDLITERTQSLGLCGPVDCRGRWPLAVLGLSHTFPRFSEYLTYASFMIDKENKGGPKLFNYIPFPEYGMGGLRMRNATKFLEQLIESVDADSDTETSSRASDGTHSEGFTVHQEKNTQQVMETNGGFSYQEVLTFAKKYFGREGLPPYLQLEHVYSASLLPEAPPRVWEYYRAYVHGDKLVPRLATEAILCRRKLLGRRAMWWERFERANCIFIHIPKNAGTSVERIFTLNECVEDVSPAEAHQSQHFTASELRDDKFAVFEQLFKFCLVRNPYERLVSAYLYLRGGGNQRGAADLAWSAKLKELGNFESFVRRYFGHNEPVKWAENELPTHFVPQHYFVCAEDGTLLVDAYLDMEDFAQHGLAPLMRRGLPEAFGKLSEIPHLRKSAPAGCTVGFTQELADFVYQAYQKDFDTFHFDRDSWRNL